MSSLDGTGLGVILAFYALVAGVGIWAGWRNRGKGDDHRNGHIVGARDINMGELGYHFMYFVRFHCKFKLYLLKMAGKASLKTLDSKA